MERSKSAEDFIAKLPQWSDLLTELRAVLQSTGLEETIKWGVPNYTLNGKNIVGGAKRADTRASRLKKVVPMILAGKGLNEKYRC